MNFFEWIRNGVRRAILLGVSDAVGQIGTLDQADPINHRLLDMSRNTLSDALGNPVQAPPPRKKLGRTLSDIQAATGKTG